MKKSMMILLLLLFYAVEAQEEVACTLIVKVENIPEVKGNLMLAVYNEQSEFLQTAIAWGDTTIVSNTGTFVFNGLKKGTYAVSIYQDENENGRLDSNFLGIPSEPYAFSNNAKGRFGPPSFEECQFTLDSEQKQIKITL